MHLTTRHLLLRESELVKILLRGPSNPFADALMPELKQKLAGDDVVFWAIGDPVPAADAEVVLGMGKVGAEEMDALPGLKLIQTVSDGYDAVDVEAATERGIWVSYAPGTETGNADSVAEFAVLLVLAASRRVGVALRSIEDASVPRPLLNQSMLDMAVCIVGWGAIGERVGRRLQPFGVKLSAVNRSPEKIPNWAKAWPLEQLDQALSEADVVVVCVRGAPENEHLFDAGRFAAMKRGAMLVNIARGTLVDEKALLAAIRSGQIAGAGLDVQEHEPVRMDDPLMAVPQVFVTPHIAGFTTRTLEGSVAYVVKVLEEYRAGRKVDSMLNEPKQPRAPLQAQ